MNTVVVIREDESTDVQHAADATLVVTQPEITTVVAVKDSPTALVIRSPAQGPAGSAGSGAAGQPRFYGHGAPTFLPGMTLGDLYLDLDTGTIYELS